VTTISHSNTAIVSALIATICCAMCIIGYGAIVVAGQSYSDIALRVYSYIPIVNWYVAIDRVGVEGVLAPSIVGICSIPFYLIFIFAIAIRGIIGSTEEVDNGGYDSK
jgi:hypothetical protein